MLLIVVSYHKNNRKEGKKDKICFEDGSNTWNVRKNLMILPMKYKSLGVMYLQYFALFIIKL
jgi:hypothetical protein